MAWCNRNGFILYYGDAQAHLDLSRSILDSRTPGYDNLGTVWLPLLHLLCLPFVGRDSLWASGLAGSIPVACCYVLGGTCLYRAALIAYGDRMAGVVVLGTTMLNPNLLYLSAITMTETVFLAGLAVLMLALVECSKAASPSAHLRWLLVGIVASWATSLTRYDGWFLIPFAAAWFGWCSRRFRPYGATLLFAVLAAFAPTYWIFHNWWESGNPFDFYNGPYSAGAIQAGRPYPGLHNWWLAIRYYAEASRFCAGWPLLFVGLAGLIVAWWKKVAALPSFLLLTPLFYVWSIHSSGLPIHLPSLPPHSYYNTRYALAVVELCGFSAGALVLLLPERTRRLALYVPVIAILPWLANFSPENWICWKESQVNSLARRFYRDQAAAVLRRGMNAGDNVLLQCCGDVSDVLGVVGIPMRSAIHEANAAWWNLAISRPDIFQPEAWALARDGDPVDLAMKGRGRSSFTLISQLHVQGEKAFKIYRRNGNAPSQGSPASPQASPQPIH